MRQQAAGILFLFCWQTALVRQRAAAEAETRQRAGPVSCRLMQRGAFSSGRISNQILLAVGQKHNEILVCARSMVGLPRAGEAVGEHQTDVHPLLNEGILWHPWRPAESGRV